MMVNGPFFKPHSAKAPAFAAIHVCDNGRRLELTPEEPDKIILHYSDGVFGQLGVTTSTRESGALKAYKEGRITGVGIVNAFAKHLATGCDVTLNVIIQASSETEEGNT